MYIMFGNVNGFKVSVKAVKCEIHFSMLDIFCKGH